MVTRVRCAGHVGNAHLVRTPVVPRDVAYSDARGSAINDLWMLRLASAIARQAP